MRKDMGKDIILYKAEIIEANFRKKTVTFRLPEGFKVIAGEYVIAQPTQSVDKE